MTNHQEKQGLEQPRQLVWVKHTIPEVKGGMDNVCAPH